MPFYFCHSIRLLNSPLVSCSTEILFQRLNRLCHGIVFVNTIFESWYNSMGTRLKCKEKEEQHNHRKKDVSWFTWHMSYKRQELFIYHELPSSSPDNSGVYVNHHFNIIVVVLLCVFTFWVPRCDVQIKTMFGSSLPPVVVLFTLFVFLVFVFVLCLVYPMLPVSLYYIFVIAPLVFSKVYLHICDTSFGIL